MRFEVWIDPHTGDFREGHLTDELGRILRELAGVLENIPSGYEVRGWEIRLEDKHANPVGIARIIAKED